MKYLLFFLSIFFITSINAFAELSQEEKNWISKNPIIKVGVDENWPPFDFVDYQKNHQGIASEYLSYISSQTGLNFEIYSNKWKNVIEKAKNRELDILACVANTPKRREYLDFTEPYLDVDIVVVAKKGFKLKSFDDIQNYVIATPKNNYVHEKLKKRFPNLKLKFVNSNKEALQTVSYGLADVYVGNLPVVTYNIDRYFLTNLEVKFKSEFESAKLSIGVNKGNEVLLSILKKSLNNIPSKEKEKINKKWIHKLEEFEKVEDKSFNFTPEELSWIYKNKEIKIAGDGYWHPYSYFNDKGDYIGIVPDLIKLLKKKSGLNIKYIKTSSWSETLDLMENKKIDVVDAISYTKERSKYINFSTKYFGTDIVILGRNDKDRYINSLNKIVNKSKIATVRNYVVSNAIKEDFPSIQNFREYETAQDGLKALASNQIDYFILDIPSFDYYSKKYGLGNIKIVGPTGYHFDYSLGIQKDNKILLSIVNKILHSISKDEIDKIYRKWVKVDYEEKIDYDLIWKLVLGFFVLLLGFIFWNRKLKREIDEKKLAQEKLSKSRDFVSSIMNSQLDIIVVTDGKRVREVNKAFFDVLKFKNLPEFEKDYKCICDLFDTSNEKFLRPQRQGVLWIDEVLENPLKIHKAKINIENKEYIFKVAASKIKGENLKTAVFHDITEVESLHKDLVQAKEKAESAAKHKSEFLANMSHEIRTPMNSVIGFTELLDKEINDPVQKDYLSSIKKGGNALLGIINDILDLSKIEAGKLEIKNESINPKNLILEIESIFHSKIVTKNLNFIVEIDKNIPPFIIIDGIRIRQVLFNLIGNAIKFTEQGTIKLKVENQYKDNIKSKIDLKITVEDSGIGIDKKHLNSIFDAFEQSQNEKEYGGTGLGLSICSRLVKMMNGSISVESQKGVGSKFIVLLKDIAVSSVGEKIEVSKLDYKKIKFEKATILVVDDIEENRKLVKHSLKDFDFQLVFAQNGQEALDRLKDVKIDLILMDLRMPIMDGYQAAVIIKEDPELKNIPLLALTASVMGKDLEKAKEYGFDGYLRKPVILDNLIEKISDFLAFKFIDTEVLHKKDDLLGEHSIEKVENIINQLENDLKNEWSETKDKGDFFLIEEFANKLKALCEDSNIYILNHYVDDLKNYIEAFDIEKVDYLMNSYEELIDKIKKLKDENE